MVGVGGGNAGTAASGYGLNGESLRDSAMYLGGGAPVYSLAPVFNLNLEASLPLTIASDSSILADYVDFTAKASQAAFTQSLTLAADRAARAVNTSKELNGSFFRFWGGGQKRDQVCF